MINDCRENIQGLVLPKLQQELLFAGSATIRHSRKARFKIRMLTYTSNIYEPELTIFCKVECAPSEDSGQSLRCSLEDALDPCLPTECSAKTLIN